MQLNKQPQVEKTKNLKNNSLDFEKVKDSL